VGLIMRLRRIEEVGGGETIVGVKEWM